MNDGPATTAKPRAAPPGLTGSGPTLPTGPAATAAGPPEPPGSSPGNGPARQSPTWPGCRTTGPQPRGARWPACSYGAELVDAQRLGQCCEWLAQLDLGMGAALERTEVACGPSFRGPHNAQRRVGT